MLPTRKNHPDAIVDAAIEVLADGGFARFSVLRVAKAYGIRQSHLAYYFPTREDLLAAMSRRLVARYEQLVEGMCREALSSGVDPVGHIIDRLISDAVTPPTSVIFPALWEAANEDQNMAAALDQIYSRAQERFIEMLGLDPRASEAASLWDLIRVLGVIVEGCTAIYGRRSADDLQLARLRVTARQLLLPAFEAALAQGRHTAL